MTQTTQTTQMYCGLKETEIGDIPTDWQVVQLGSYLSLIRNGISKQQIRVETPFPVTRIETISEDRINPRRVGYLNEVTDSEIQRFRLDEGDILISHINSEPQLGRSVVYEEKPPFLLHGMNLLRLKVADGLLPHFLHHLFAYYRETGRFISVASRAVNQSSINQGKMQALPIPLPPLDEQRRIAAALSAIQQAIAAQDDVISAAKEVKRSLMHRLFTYGPGREPAETKETPYGSVPEHWRQMSLDKCAYVQTGAAKGRRFGDSDIIEVPYLRVANVQDGYLDLSEIKFITIKKDEFERYSLQNGDVVLTEGGDFDKLGRGFIWRGQVSGCIHQNHIFAVRVNRTLLDPEYLAYLVQSSYGKSYFLTVAHRTTNLASINSTKLKAFPVTIPNKSEQEHIINTMATIDRKIAAEEDRKAALQALFRSTLHSLMTGQLRLLND